MPSEPGSARRIQLEIRSADPLTFDGDAIIVPTLSEGWMVEGVAARIKNLGGKVVEDEARCRAPIAVGAAVVTGAGSLAVRHVVHVPVAEHPGARVAVENIRRATRAGLLAASHFQLERVAIPGIGYGETGVPYDEAARAMIDEIRAFRGACPGFVVLMDTDAEMIASFEDEVGSK
jgi:O-acetyl-ADP-ribose deacetylase (regulator of RNase III)